MLYGKNEGETSNESVHKFAIMKFITLRGISKANQCAKEPISMYIRQKLLKLAIN